MSTGYPILDYDDLRPRPNWPLSRMYHEESKLSDRRSQAFQEAIAEFANDPAAVRHSATAQKTYPSKPTVSLPRAGLRLFAPSLRSVLASRRTRRGQFADAPVSLKQLGSLLDLACGHTGQIRHPEYPDVTQKLRSWPSGGALYPIELYATVLRSSDLPPATYHYQVEGHLLEQTAPNPTRQDLMQSIFAEGLWINASLMIVLTGVFARTQTKYGERGYRFILLDAGHLAQNLLLVAEELRLAAVPLGGFCDDTLARWLGLNPSEEAPLYIFLLGQRQGSRHP